MDGDAYKDMSHYEMQQFLWRTIAPIADYAKIENMLPNGKIADVWCVIGGTRYIIEVKTRLKYSLIESAWRKYHEQCDYLILCVPPQEFHDDSAPLLSGWPDKRFERVGIWFCDWSGVRQVTAPTLLNG